MNGLVIGSIWGVGLLITFGLWGIEKALIKLWHNLQQQRIYMSDVAWQLMLMNNENATWEHDDENAG